MQAFRASGGIDAGQSASDVQSSVAADIAKHDGGTNASVPEPEQTQAQPESQVTQAASSARQSIASGLDTSSVIAGRISDRISAQPTPGGIAAALIVLFILVFILIPVDVSKQYSRAQLLFLSLLGHTRLIGRRMLGSNPGSGGSVVPSSGSEGDPSPGSGSLYIEPLYSEPIDVDAQSQYNEAMVVEEISYEQVDNTESDYWETIDSIDHDGL